MLVEYGVSHREQGFLLVDAQPRNHLEQLVSMDDQCLCIRCSLEQAMILTGAQAEEGLHHQVHCIHDQCLQLHWGQHLEPILIHEPLWKQAG